MTVLDTKIIDIAQVSAATETPSAPTLLSPPDGAVGVSLTPTLSWTPSSGAASYRVQLAKDQGFTQLVFEQAGLATTTIDLAGLEPSITYYWRVSAYNQLGVASDWSTTWSFTTQVTTPAPSLSLEPVMALMALGLMVGMVGGITQEV